MYVISNCAANLGCANDIFHYFLPTFKKHFRFRLKIYFLSVLQWSVFLYFSRKRDDAKNLTPLNRTTFVTKRAVTKKCICPEGFPLKAPSRLVLCEMQ